MSNKGDKMIISEGCVVTIHYTLTNDAGDILDTSSGQEPMTYLHGFGGMIPGLEFALEEKSVGDTLTVDLAPNEGYGPVNPELIHDVPIGALAQIENLEVGMQLQSKDDEGREIILMVDAVSDTHARLNANHPMAGECLHFDISIEHIRPATEAELAKGRTNSGQNAI